MSTLTHNHNGLARDTESPSCLEQSDTARIEDLSMEEETHDPLHAEPRIQEGGDNGDDEDDEDNQDISRADGSGGYGVNNMDPGAIVDGVLADLPEPSRHHILPDLEEYDRERPAPCSAI